MGVLDRMRKLFSGSSTEKFRRWSPEELLEKKKFLEGKNPKEFTKEDHYLAAEWVIQRYLPEGEEPSSERWQEKITDIREKIDRNIELAKIGKLEKAQGESHAPTGGITLEEGDDPDFHEFLVRTLSK